MATISKTAAKKLFNIYVDEHINVFLRDMNVVTVNEEQGEVKISMVADGYCIDVDQDFIYLGLPDGTITKTISHNLGQFIEIAFSGGELLDNDFPTDDMEIN